MILKILNRDELNAEDFSLVIHPDFEVYDIYAIQSEDKLILIHKANLDKYLSSHNTDTSSH